MFCWDYSHLDPAMNLAIDEAILQYAESESQNEMIRFWESSHYFVVLGLTQSLEEEVNSKNCRADGIPVLRRCSAGGCVLQGPGCLNYALILDQEKRPDIHGITSSYKSILNTIISTLKMPGLSHVGISDLAVNGLKVSGNAQRRRKRFILHHGTLLFNFNIENIPAYIKEPTIRPEYRRDRIHTDFLETLTLEKYVVKSDLKDAFSTKSELFYDTEKVINSARELVRTKYSSKEWICRK